MFSGRRAAIDATGRKHGEGARLGLFKITVLWWKGTDATKRLEIRDWNSREQTQHHPSSTTTNNPHRCDGMPMGRSALATAGTVYSETSDQLVMKTESGRKTEAAAEKMKLDLVAVTSPSRSKRGGALGGQG